MDPIHDLGQFRSLVAGFPAERIPPGPGQHPRLALFAAARDRLESEAVGEVLRALSPDSPLGDAVGHADADLRVYELDLDHPAVELGADEAARTIAYGMTAIEPGPDLFCLAGIREAPRALSAVGDALARGGEPLDILRRHGGRDTACLFGALAAARMAKKPVVIDGAQAFAAACLIHAIAPHAVSHCWAPQGSPYEAMAARWRLSTIPFAKGPFPLSLARAAEAWRVRQHGLA